MASLASDYNLKFHTNLQLVCAPAFMIISAVQILLAEVYDPPAVPAWEIASLAVGVMGIAAAGIQVAVVHMKSFRWWLLVYLIYLLLFMAFRVMFFVFGLNYGDSETWKVVLEILLTMILIFLGWVQIYSTLKLAKLWKFEDVFKGHPTQTPGRLPTEELPLVMAQLDYHPTEMQIVELLSVLPEGSSVFSFPHFCLILERFSLIRRYQPARPSRPHRPRSTREEPLIKPRNVTNQAIPVPGVTLPPPSANAEAVVTPPITKTIVQGNQDMV